MQGPRVLLLARSHDFPHRHAIDATLRVTAPARFARLELTVPSGVAADGHSGARVRVRALDADKIDQDMKVLAIEGVPGLAKPAEFYGSASTFWGYVAPLLFGTVLAAVIALVGPGRHLRTDAIAVLLRRGD